VNEEWRPVVGVDGYEVSNLGNLRSYRVILVDGYRSIKSGRRAEPKALKLTPNADGYLVWGAYDAEKGKVVQYRAHHAVLEAFVGPRPEGLIARHLNGNSADNRVENLAWGTAQENINDRIRHGTDNAGDRSHTVKLTWEKVREIRASALTPLELAAQYDVTLSNIYKILRRESWKNDLPSTPSEETP
jgi:hypothetical protein